MKAWIWQVFRNKNEGQLIPELPPVYQRRYGDPNFDGPYNHHYVKPLVAKADAKVSFHPGMHRVFEPERYEWSSQQFSGTHWHLADVEIAIEREMRKERLIADDQKWLVEGITEETIRAKCREHLDDPRLF